MRIGRRTKPDPEAVEAVRQARAEAFQRRAEGLRVRVRGAALETRRRLRPVVRPFAALIRGTLGRIAPLITRPLLFLLRVGAALVALVLEVSQAVLGWLGARIGRAAAATGRFASTHVTPLGTFALVAGIAALALGVSQFFDYHAVVAGEPDYRGEVGTVAPAPRTDVEVTGGAHLYLLLPVAIAALALVWATYRGDWRLGRWVGVMGLVGIAVSLLVDLPQGLNAGNDSVAFSGSHAELIEGYWAQLSASVVLALSGLALGAEARRAAASEESPEPTKSRRRAIWRRRPRAATDGPGLAAGGGTGS